MDDVQNLEQGLPNTNSSQIKQGRGKSNKNQQTRHFYGKWHRTSVSQNFSQESRFSNVISMWSAKTYHVWGWSLALASPSLAGDFAPCAVTGEALGNVFSTSLVEGHKNKPRSYALITATFLGLSPLRASVCLVSSSPIVPPSSPGEAFRGRVKHRKPIRILEK